MRVPGSPPPVRLPPTAPATAAKPSTPPRADGPSAAPLRSVAQSGPKAVEPLLAQLATAPTMSFAELERRSPLTLHALAEALPPELRGVTRTEPHFGLGTNPFDFAKLGGMGMLTRKALETYLARDFPSQPSIVKKLVLAQLASITTEAGQRELVAFHRPQVLGTGRWPRPITHSLECEGQIRSDPAAGILDYYGPSATGALDPKVASEAFVARLFDGGAPPFTRPDRATPPGFTRLSSAAKVKSVEWRDLTVEGRRAYLKDLELRDPSVKLVRIRDPRKTGTGAVAPKTLVDPLTWEILGNPGQVWEAKTASYYLSRDQLAADVAFLDHASGGRGGFHVHGVVDVRSREEWSTIGPPLVAMVALEDLRLFAGSLARGGTLHRHPVLRCWRAAELARVSDALSVGATQEIDATNYKFGCVGLRREIYGNDHRVGYEIRANPVGAPSETVRTAGRMASALASASFLSLPPPPWEGWDAGDPGLPARAYAAALADPRNATAAAGAKTSFAALVDKAKVRGRDDGFRYLAPLWRFEALPGLSENEKGAIGAARQVFVERLLALSRGVTKLESLGRPVPAERLERELTAAIHRFFADAKIADALTRVLEERAHAEEPT